MLIQKKQLKPLKGIIVKLEDMEDDDWNEMNALAKSTIRLHLAELVYFTIVNEKTMHELWMKLCATYEKVTTSNKVYLMKRLFKLQMC